MLMPEKIETANPMSMEHIKEATGEMSRPFA